MALIDLPDAIDLAFDETGLPDDGRHEPLFTAAPRPGEVAELRRLDPSRVDLGAEPAPARRSLWRGPAGSLLLHLLPLLVFVGWPKTPLDIPPPIPIQLVIETPPPPPPEPPKPAPPKPAASPPAGVRASDDFGAVVGDKIDRNTGAATPAPGAPPPAAENQPAAAAAEPNPAQEQVAAVPQPAPAPAHAAPRPPPLPPKPAPPKQQAAIRMPKPEGEAWPLPLTGPAHEAPHMGRAVGPNASRDEYCAFVLSLMMSHIDLLPRSMLGARHGDTSVIIRVLQDGTIDGVRVVQGSGYADIDERVEQMVKAAGRLPPLPQWVPGPWADLTFHMHFPHPAER